ncbi:Xyloglucan endotransglucosylase/hydrolase [Rhynchospora pubera]|uniref:Xyloglucan endotransglucosylase/hydrolase n=1 Tax=Rhynchospora pubera TaxID=906938 RepID=A0AAV8GNB4_9POAL|nr:Xyloglucan endotransglucosylase/hydrolase [Rhynchospora pubera]
MVMGTSMFFLRIFIATTFFFASIFAFDVPTIAFEDGFSKLFGDDNLVISPDGKSVSLTLNRYTGSGFISSEAYHNGFFSASIKLPKGHSAGVVVAFYLSNGDVYDKTHDELDFEFLGNRRGREWRIQTNVYGNGSTDHGREERYLLPFDPSEAFHQYSILWTANHIIFYIDNVPIREVIRAEGMGLDYPSKPMYLYATIWDGSAWATENGKYKVSYKYSPFIAEFTDLVLVGCQASATDCTGPDFELATADYNIMTLPKRSAMRRYRERYMTYTVCYDIIRYPTTFPECEHDSAERQTFWDWGESKIVMPPKPRSRSKRRVRPARNVYVGQRVF